MPCRLIGRPDRKQEDKKQASYPQQPPSRPLPYREKNERGAAVGRMPAFLLEMPAVCFGSVLHDEADGIGRHPLFMSDEAHPLGGGGFDGDGIRVAADNLS